MKAIWKDTVLAESTDTKILENNPYFPPESINCEFFQLSDSRKNNSEKGKASFFHLKVGDHKIQDAAWFYPHPSGEASKIQNYVAFSEEVKIVEK